MMLSTKSSLMSLPNHRVGQRLSLMDSTGTVDLEYGFDLVGRIESVTDRLSGGPPSVWTFEHDLSGRRSAISFPAASGARVEYQRDAIGQLTGLDHLAAVDLRFAYPERNGRGHVLRVERDLESQSIYRSYSYDERGQLVSSTTSASFGDSVAIEAARNSILRRLRSMPPLSLKVSRLTSNFSCST